MRNQFHGFKKVSSDGKSTTFAHPNGARITIPHAALDAKTLKQMSAMPIHQAEGTQDLPDETQLKSDVDDRLGQIGNAATSVKNFLFGDPNSDEAKYFNPQKSAAPQDSAPAPQAPPPPPPEAAAPTNVTLANPASMRGQTVQMPGATASPGLDQYNPEQGVRTQMAGIQNEAKAVGAMEDQKAQLYQQQNIDLARLNDEAQRNSAAHELETKNVIDDMKAGHIDPKAYVNSMSTGKKVGTAIGLLLGGMGQGMIGGSNPALDMLQKQIDEDVRAQMANLDNKKSIFNAMEKQYGNKVDAQNMTRAFYTAKQINDINEAASKSGSAVAAARAQQATGPLQAQLAQIHQSTGIRQALQNGAAGNMDPAQFVPYVVPKEHQQKVFDEIESAQNITRSRKEIMAAYDRAADSLHGMDFVPGTLNADQKALHTMLGPTFKDVEGTVRQAAMDNLFKNVTPQFGDIKAKAIKRAALEEYLNSKSAAPTAKGYGLDLTKFKSTNFGGAHFRKR